MKYHLAINGYGRIGRSILRAFYERKELHNILKIIAINELADLKTMAYLTRYDSTHGRFPDQIDCKGESLCIGKDHIKVSHAKSPEDLPWQKETIDLLLECSGSYKSRFIAEQYLNAGAQRLLFSQPAGSDVDNTIVYGINHDTLSQNHRIVSNGSCTTNAIVPVLKLLHDEFCVKEGTTTTVHSAMNDQPVTDAYHQTNLRLTRAAMQAVIPVETRLHKGIERLLPELAGCFSSIAIRVPTINVSLIDLTVRTSRKTTADDVNAFLQGAANLNNYQNIIDFSDEPHASVDFNHNANSVVIDGTQTRVSNNHLIKLVCWFDNEWGFANRMLDTAVAWLSK